MFARLCRTPFGFTNNLNHFHIHNSNILTSSCWESPACERPRMCHPGSLLHVFIGKSVTTAHVLRPLQRCSTAQSIGSRSSVECKRRGLALTATQARTQPYTLAPIWPTVCCPAGPLWKGMAHFWLRSCSKHWVAEYIDVFLGWHGSAA
jgi:hypothetical protein